MRKKLHTRIASAVLAAAVAVSTVGTVLPVTVWAAEDEDTGAVEVTEGNSDVITADETVKVDTSEYASGDNNFNADWKFYLGTSGSASQVNFNDSSWDTVTLPHDFSISQDFTTSGEAESGFLPGGTGWYRKTFTLPESMEDKTFVLNFDGVYSDAYVYVNGTQVGENHYGYNSFAFDISEYLTCDGSTENVIAVRAVNSIPTSRWYSGSGIYRDVTLTIEDKVHVARYGTTVTTPDIASGSGTVQVVTEVQNDTEEAAEVTVRQTVLNSNGDAVSSSSEKAVTVKAGETAEVTQADLSVSSPSLWDLDSPTLYTVSTEILMDQEVVDTCETDFGFRYYSFASSGFSLNGKNVKINGVCLHHDQGALGSAGYDDAFYRQLVSMKEMGANAVRTTHAIADEDFIDLCNELGLLVVEEAFDGWSDAKNGNSNDFSVYFNAAIGSGNNLIGAESSTTWAEFAIKSMVRRDRNDPSVILWSLGNEIQEGTSWGSTSSFASVAQNLINWVEEEDSTRPCTSGDNNRGSSTQLINVITTITGNGGIAGFNYANSASTLASLVSSYAGSAGSILASETSSAVNSRGIYSSMTSRANADGLYHLTSYDVSAVSWGITAHESIYNTYTNDAVAGEFVWTGWDYIGEPTPWNGTGTGSVSGSGAIPNSSYFGIVDTAGFEKDTYYLYSAQWNQDVNTLHLVTAWDSSNMYTSSSKTPVVIYSNAPVVKLYRNGTLIGTATRSANTSSAGHTYYTYSTASNSSSVCTAVAGSGSTALYATFNVAFASGTISAKAFAADGTTEITDTVGTSSVSTPGTASQLVISQDKTVIDADGESLAYISVDVTDADGNLITTATNEISFTLTGAGEIAGVDNGDQAATAKFQQSSVLTDSKTAKIKAYAGKALAIVKSTENAGNISVSVTSGSLTGGTVGITANAVSDGRSDEALESYTLTRDYTVKLGTVPTLSTKATGTLVSGETVDGTLEWEDIPEEVETTAGDYTVSGTADFGTCGTFAVTCRIHVVNEIATLRNIAVVTGANTVPELPGKVSGIMFDGTLSGEYEVTWDAVTADQFATVGDIITVSGTASVFGDETLPVTASVRVAEAVSTESTNIGPQVLSLEQDIASANQSDVLTSIINGTTKPGDNTNERWTNWNNRKNSDTATLTFTWATAHTISAVNLYYYIDNCSNVAESVTFEYSLDGTTYTEIGNTAELVEEYSLGKEYTYTFDSPVNPIALKIILVQQDGTTGNHCVGITEAEIMTWAGTIEAQSDAELTEIAVDGTAVDGVTAGTYEYEAAVPKDGKRSVTASADSNVGITVLPEVSGGIVRILTVSENESSVNTYVLTLTEAPCTHEKTSVVGAKAATCTEDGYTGDTVCEDCGEVIEEGSVISATGHSWDAGSVTQAATCEEPGVRTFTCGNCGETRTEEIAALGHSYGEPEWTWNENNTASAVFTCANDASHTETVEAEVTFEKTEDGYVYKASVTFNNETWTDTKEHTHTWDDGTVTKEASCEEAGEITYSCTGCDETKTEEIKATGHAYGEPVWSWNGYTEAFVTFTCENDTSHEEKVEAEITSDISGYYIRYTASVTFNGNEYTNRISRKGTAFELFSDLEENEWYSEAISFAVDHEFMGDYLETGTFAPYESISRGTVITVLYKMAGSPKVEADDSFSEKCTDVTETDWCYDAVRWAYSIGMTNGYYGTNTFKPYEPVIRQTLSSMFTTYLKLVKEEKITGYDLDEVFKDSKLTDADEIADWSSESVAWMVANGYMAGAGGKNAFCPNDSATRVAFAMIIYNMYEILQAE